MNVRPAVRQDLDRLAYLEAVSFQDAWDWDSLARELADPRTTLLVASRDPAGKPDAYAIFRQIADEAELLRVGVAPDERRHGLARALILEGLGRLRNGEVQVCFLEVRIDNVAAITLYESLGFGRAGLRRGYYRDGTDALILGLEM